MIARMEEGIGGEGVDDSADTAIARPARRAMRTREPGLDLICTKVAVDFQSITLSTAEERINTGLQSLTDACGADSVFVALLDDVESAFDKVYLGRSTFSACNPEVLKSRALSEFPWIKSRLEHLRLLEIRDTAKAPIAQSHDAEHLARLNVGALLVVGFNIRGRLRGVLGVVSATPSPDWGADLHLALKLVSVSVASGLERIELLEDLFTVEERDRLVTQTANDGLWDFDVATTRCTSRRAGRAMLGYADDGIEVRRTGGSSCIPTISRACRARSASTSRASTECSKACTACGTAAASGAGS